MSSKLNKDELDKVKCQICLSIMKLPVTLPCHHELCYSCYENSINMSNLVCPFCRLRLSVWARRAIKTNSIVNWKKWEFIKENYKDLIDKGDDDSGVFDSFEQIQRKYYEPGELMQEYKQLLKKDEEERMKEDQESLKLIERLIAEEKNQLKQQEDYDELMALKLQEFNRKTKKDYGIRNRNNQINYSEDCIIIDD